MTACRSEKVEKADEAYFDSYGYFDIHRTMLGDKVRSSGPICWALGILGWLLHFDMRVSVPT